MQQRLELLERQRQAQHAIENKQLLRKIVALLVLGLWCEMADISYSRMMILLCLVHLWRQSNKTKELYNQTLLAGSHIEYSRLYAHMGDLPRFLKVFEGAAKIHINACDRAKKQTLLHQAAIGGHPEIVRLILINGGDCNAKDSEGNTPLYYGIKNVISNKPNAYQTLAQFLEFNGGLVTNSTRDSVTFFSSTSNFCQANNLNMSVNPLSLNNRGETALELFEMGVKDKESEEYRKAHTQLLVISHFYQAAQERPSV